MAVLTKYTTPALIGVILTLIGALYLSHLHSASLQQNLSEIKAQSDTIVLNHLRKVRELSEKYEIEKTAIDSRYNSIIASLREQGERKLPAASGECESEYRKRATGVLADVLRIYGKVAKYADELKLNGGNCEALRD